MAIAITKRFLGGSSYGRGLIVSATQGATLNTVHTCTTSSTATIDEVYLYAQNNWSAGVELVLEWGGSQTITCMVPSREGPTLVIPGMLFAGSGTDVTINAWLNTTASLVTSGSGLFTVHGWVNRMVQS